MELVQIIGIAALAWAALVLGLALCALVAVLAYVALLSAKEARSLLSLRLRHATAKDPYGYAVMAEADAMVDGQAGSAPDVPPSTSGETDIQDGYKPDGVVPMSQVGVPVDASLGLG